MDQIKSNENRKIAAPSPLCGHPPDSSFLKAHKKVCGLCGSFWDLESLTNETEYRKDYSSSRFHYDNAVGIIKVKTLQRWLTSLSIDVSELVVCEVGFGGGWTLRYFHEHARSAYGIELLRSNLDFAAEIGIPVQRLFQFKMLPDTLPEKVDLWIFQDSFEHIDEPSKFLAWALANSDHPRTLLVAPRADSLSERILGRYWPHKVDDHKFHWSKPGIIEFFEHHNMKLKNEFFPTKYVSLKTIFAHIGHKFNWPLFGILAERIGFTFAIPFNFGEMGLLFSER
jgi:hypothetical protein